MKIAPLTVAGILLAGCGSGSTPAPDSGSNIGACVQTVKGDPTTIVGCEEYLPGNESILTSAMSTCNGASSTFVDNKWVVSCPTGQVQGCKYGPGKNGTPGGEIIWSYKAGSQCNADAMTVTPTTGAGGASGAGTAGAAGGAAGATGGTGGAAGGTGGATGAGGTTGAAGSGVQGTVPAAGMFVWMVNGQTLSASNSAGSLLVTNYLESATNKDAKSLQIVISGQLATGESCELTGQFQTVPPPAGTYPIVATAVDGAFTSACASGTQASGASVSAFVGKSGQVVLTKSVVGDVEGTFAMQAAPLLPLNSPTTAYSGGFNVTCSDLLGGSTSSRCTAHTSGVGTCADLMACCASPTVTSMAVCNGYYNGYKALGDTSCGNYLSVNKSALCP